MRKKKIFTIALLTIIVLSLLSCRKRVESIEVAPIKVSVLVIDSIENGLTRTYIGEVKESMSLSLNFPLGGKVQEVLVHEGDNVSKGELLMRIDKHNAQNSYNVAKSTLQKAEDGYARLKKVYDLGSVAEIKWVEMQTDLEKARSMEQIAKKQLEDCDLTSPISGIVGNCTVEAGASLLPGEPAITLLDIHSITIIFSVPESEISTIKIGQETSIEIPALHKSFRGKITNKSVNSDRIAHTYQVEVNLPNPDKSLLPGMVCKIFIAQPNERGYIIPAKAVQTRQEGLSVWIIKNGIATRTPIESSEFVANGILVKSGLLQGDSVVVRGFQKLYNNAEVIISKEDN